MANDKIAMVMRGGGRGDEGRQYYQGAPDDIELVTAIFQSAYSYHSSEISLIDKLPVGEEAFPFPVTAQMVNESESMNLGREAARLQGLQERLITYLSQE